MEVIVVEEILFAGEYKDKALPASEGNIASFLAVYSSPDLPMQRHWHRLCHCAKSVLKRIDTSVFAAHEQRTRTPLTLEEIENLEE